MKSVLISTRPKWCEKICHEIGKEESGKPIYEKRIEVRKTAPKEVPFKAYIYETKESKMRYLNDRFNSFLKNKSHYTDMGKVIGEFICDKILEIEVFKNGAIENFWFYNLDKSCLSFDEMGAYIGKGNIGYGLHITDLKIYDKPKELSEFSRPCSYEGLCSTCKRFKANGSSYDICNAEITRPPQSWCYVEEL